MQWKEIERIMKDNGKYLKMLEYYDSTGRFPLDKSRRTFTLREMSVSRLKELSRERGKSMSALLDELIGKA